MRTCAPNSNVTGGFSFLWVNRTTCSTSSMGGPPAGNCAGEHRGRDGFSSHKQMKILKLSNPFTSAVGACGCQICQCLPEWPVIVSWMLLDWWPCLSSHSPNPDSFTCSRPSTRQLEGFRLPWEPRGLLWRNNMPWKRTHEPQKR